MEILLLIALFTLMVVVAARAAGERREPARVPARVSRQRTIRRR